MALSVPTQVVNLYLVAENRLFRQMLARLFRKRSDMCVVGEGCYSELVSEAIASSPCDVLLLDFSTTLSSTDLTSRVLKGAPHIKVVMFGMDEDPDVFLKAVRSGASGYVLKDASAAELVDAVHGAMQGQAVCPQKLCMTLFQLVSREYQEMGRVTDQVARNKPGLTYRQRQLAGLVAMGKTNKEIAASLNLSEFTVKNHIRRIMRHVDAHTRYDAVDALRASGSLPSA